MKILTGSLRGRTIEFKANPSLRPTLDKARQAIFNALQGEVEGKNVLDLFSGTGALGIEALSQGAGKVTFVEKDRALCRQLKDNLSTLGLADKSRILSLEVVTAIGQFSKTNEYFDLIFLDPPYEKDLGMLTLQAISESPIIHEQTMIICEARKTETLPAKMGRLGLLKAKLYGDTKIMFYKQGQD